MGSGVQTAAPRAMGWVTCSFYVADVGAVCPSPLAAYRAPNFCLNSSLWLLLRLRYHWSMSFGSFDHVKPNVWKVVEAVGGCISIWSHPWESFSSLPFLKDIKITEFCLDILFIVSLLFFAPLSFFLPYIVHWLRNASTMKHVLTTGPPLTLRSLEFGGKDKHVGH